MKEKEEWERNILGIGKCMEVHGDDKVCISKKFP